MRRWLLLVVLAAGCERKQTATAELAASGDARPPAAGAAKPPSAGEAKPPAAQAASREVDSTPAAAAAPAREATHPSWSPAGKRWANRMIELTSAQFCKPGMYFQSCFQVTADECRQLAADMMRRCLDKHPDHVPADVNARTGEVAGQKLGTCAGTDFEVTLRKQGKFTDTPRCNDVDYWMRAAANAR